MVFVFHLATDSVGRSRDYCGPFISTCKKVLSIIVMSEPNIRKNLLAKRKSLDKAIEGLGQHGLVGTSDENLINLHDALKVCTWQISQCFLLVVFIVININCTFLQGRIRRRRPSTQDSPV